MKKIQPKDARYIKLGEGGKYESVCFRENVLRLGYYEFPNFGNMSDGEIREKALEFALTQYRDKGAAKNHARQVADFYCCGADTLWFTFFRGGLYWCFAASKVEYFGSDRNKFPNGSRERKAAKGGWRSADIKGKRLIADEMDGRLTQTGAYRGTICGITGEAAKYLTRIINGEKSPETEEAIKRRAALLESAVKLTRSLNPKDFELLVDLAFSQSGWRRISIVGGAQETVDIILELPSTGETAFVQVKSKTSKSQFNEYIERCQTRPETRMFYVYHTGPELTATAVSGKSITVINAARLSEMILNAGLFDWLVEKSGF